MRSYKKVVRTEQLPPALCTPEMKQAVVEAAQAENITLSELVRRAVTLFLAENYSKTIVDNSRIKDPA